MIRLTILMCLLSLSFMANSAGGDDDSNWTSSTNLNPVKRLLKKGDYEKAITRLERLKKKDADNADIYNLLGFSHRKVGRYDQAYDFYQQALKLEPKHKGANEYLGELYLETNRLQEAQKQLQVLQKICSGKCKEYKTLAKAIKAFENNQPIASSW